MRLQKGLREVQNKLSVKANRNLVHDKIDQKVDFSVIRRMQVELARCARLESVQDYKSSLDGRLHCLEQTNQFILLQWSKSSINADRSITLKILYQSSWIGGLFRLPEPSVSLEITQSGVYKIELFCKAENEIRDFELFVNDSVLRVHDRSEIGGSKKQRASSEFRTTGNGVWSESDRRPEFCVDQTDLSLWVKAVKLVKPSPIKVRFRGQMSTLLSGYIKLTKVI